MPTFVGFNTFAGLPEEQISEKIRRRILAGDQAMLVWWSIEAGVHVEPHSHANEQIAWMLKGKMEFRLGSEQRVCGPGDVVLIPGGAEHEAWFREDTEVIDFFAPPRVILARAPIRPNSAWKALGVIGPSRSVIKTCEDGSCSRCRRRSARISSPCIGWTLGEPFFALWTCNRPVANSTCDHCRSHNSDARKPWR
jgi:quercetin dioxygenase-like cupin family protein